MARTGSCHLKCLETGLKGQVMGSGKNQFLPLEVLGSYVESDIPNTEKSGKNWFLPFFSLICVSVSVGKNWFLPSFK